MPVIGFLDTTGLLRWFDAFQEGLKELGYAPGRTIAIERRVGAPAQLPDLAAELVRLQPKVIVASGSRAAVAAKNATKTIPIVLAFATDPVELGLVASIAQPGAISRGSRTRGGAGLPAKAVCKHRAALTAWAGSPLIFAQLLTTASGRFCYK